MKSIYIHCPLLPADSYHAVLEKLCLPPVRNVTVYTYADRVSEKQLDAFIEAQKAFGLAHPVRFRNILVLTGIPRFSWAVRRLLLKNNFFLRLQVLPEQGKKLVKPVARLNQKGIQTQLWVDENQDQQALYRHFSSLGLSINLDRPRYDAGTADWFSRWLYDPNAQGINTFCDIISLLTLDVHSPNCRYASCFGTTFRVDEQLQVYLCPHHMDERTCLGTLTERDRLLQGENLVQLLTGAIQKRNHCSSHCDGFAVCQGGCPLEPEAGDECCHYIATVNRIREALLDVYHNGKLGQVNPIVKNAILNALAFGSAFFN